SFRGVVDYVEAQDKKETEEFWRSYLSGYVSHPIGSGGSDADELLHYDPLVLETQVSLVQIKAAAQHVGVTPAEFSKVAWAVTLQKYTRQNDVVFGQVMANRDIPVKDADSILGPLINTVPFRVTFDETMSVHSIFHAVEANRGAILAHSFTGLVDIKRWSGVEGELFDTLFVYQQTPDLPSIDDGNDLRVIAVDESPYSHEYSLELILVPTEVGVRAQALFNPN
ncbi:hypothetical protein As57867_007741, partial [Aphanomyces stellatus]